MTSLDSNRIHDGVSKEDSILRDSVNSDLKQFSGAEAGLDNPVMETTHEQWNNPKINIYRILSANFSFIILGMNDAAYGVCTPPLFSTYVKLIILTGFNSICKFAKTTGALFTWF